MNSQLCKNAFFPAGDKKQIVCLVAGYRGKISGYQKVIDHLNKEGYAVAAYEHSPKVLSNGNPDDLIQLIDAIAGDFTEKSSGYTKKICISVSMGTGMCLNLHTKVPGITYGIYAAAGISAAKSVFHSPLFFTVRKAFIKNGVDEKMLAKAWDHLEIIPERVPNKKVPFVIALGKRDLLVSFSEARNTMLAWQKAGVPIRIIPVPRAGHTGTIRWLKRSLIASNDILH